MNRILDFFRQRSVFRRRGMEIGPLILENQRIFILPTRRGLAFGVLLGLLLLGSINYALSLGFLLTFLMGSTALISILHTHRNLSGLVVRPARADPVFAGQNAIFSLWVENPGNNERPGLSLTTGKRSPAVTAHVAGKESVLLRVPVPAPRRGRLRPGRLTLSTRFPLGLFRAWSSFELHISCIVYPAPENTTTAPPHASEGNDGTMARQGEGSDDFSGLRPYRPGDPMRRVAWKSITSDQGLLTKQFHDTSASEMWLAWEKTGNLSTEERLSRLCRWVLDAHGIGARYGLNLPGTTINPGMGPGHRDRCLTALALFGNSDSGMREEPTGEKLVA